MGFVTSRLATGVDYTFYKQNDRKINIVVDTIHINGGADVVNKRTLDTPQGVVTELTDEQLDKLKSHPVFQQHIKGGYVVIQSTEKEAKKAEADLEKDKSSQITPEDYEKGDAKKEIRKNTRKPRTKKQ